MITATIGSHYYKVYDNGLTVRMLHPEPSRKEQFKKSIKKLQNKIIREVEVIPWDKFFKIDQQHYAVFKITPTSSIRNNQTNVLAKVIASFYRKPSELRSFFKGNFLSIKKPYRVNFRIVLKPNDISFYLLLPKEKAPEILRKAEAIYDSGITISEIEGGLDKLNPKKVFCTELNYRKHPIFSLNTDRANNYPLPSLLTAVRTLEDNDVAVFDAMLEPSSPIDWYKEAKEAHNLLEKGYVPSSNLTNKALRSVHQIFTKARYELLEMTRFTKVQQKKLYEQKKEEASFIEAKKIKEEMTNATKRKQGEDILKTWLRVAVQSEDQTRAKDAAYTLSNAWKDISGDNELERTDVPKKWNEKYVEAIETRKGFSISLHPNKFSVDEVGKLLQLPGDGLIREFPQIEAQRTKEVSTPEELHINKIKAVRIGHVTERGSKKLARLPLEPYRLEGKTISQKAVYDAICTATFGQGQQGSGKSEGFGSVWAYDMVMAGFTSIIIDTADGQVLRNFVNSLPEDYPDEKIHVLNFDNKAYPIPLDWSDIYGRNLGEGDNELAALEVSERITNRFIDFINSLSNTGDFTDRMVQYVSSCMRAISFKPGWSFLDLELALTSPAFRKELLEQEEVQQELDIVQDLEDLQEKAAAGKAGQVVDNIMNRLKVLSSTTFMSNLFLQQPKLDENGKPVLDMRKLMDNEEGGYGHTIVIQASGIWEHNQATILGFMEDRINFNAFGRIDVPQDQRKPVLKWIDEPHKVIKRLEDRLAGTAVEFRKYRIKNLFTGHSIDQMGKAANSLLQGGAQITSYKTKSMHDLERFSQNFSPYDNVKELYAALPEKHTAINSVRLPSGNTCPAFIADMVEPPKQIKDRNYVWHESAKKYGRHWKEVKTEIQDRRSRYRQLDTIWLAEKKQANK
ncbi:hypothetical protein [Cytobacillus kochii]|uniref:hypothetical protein n=1 Tax=Cytobacillus kochii TaxID=859143 RepID=UPI00402AB3E2